MGLIEQAIQAAGSALLVTAFVLSLAGILTQTGRAYLALNLAGSGALVAGVLAAHPLDSLLRQGVWAAFLLEVIWAAVSAVCLLKALARPRPPHPSPSHAPTGAVPFPDIQGESR